MEKIIIFDFGSQYTQLIGRRLREIGVYSEIVPFHHKLELTSEIKGIVLSGSPASVLQEGAPQFPIQDFIGQLPVLAVCYGAQLIAQKLGGTVERSQKREYGRALLSAVETSPIFTHINEGSQVWMSHGDTILNLPPNAEVIASTADIPVAAYTLTGQDFPVISLQFHPEVYHSTEGAQMLKNYVFDICGCAGNWTPAAFAESTIADLKKTIGSDNVVLGLSGGVDSSVAGLLLHKAIGSQLHCIFVDNGLLRKNEFEDVLESYKNLGLNVKGVDASDAFLSQLAGISDPELKRKTIGRVFIEVFEKEAKAIPGVKWLAQGTIYPDVIESVSVFGPSVTIKSHHNVGGLPEKLNLKIVEPLNRIFKDEVRRVGKELLLPENILHRHPFPGPGLAIRILGDITRENVRLLQEADHIYTESLKSEGLYDEIWQAGAILLPIHSVGVMGDERTYEKVVALRAVTSTDGMTADWYDFPTNFLRKLSNDIINNVKGINRVVYDISSKPPATIEWE